MRKSTISGKTRKYTSFIEPFQQRVVTHWVPKLPLWLETYHLTLMTVPFSIAVIGLAYLARINMLWMMGISVFIFLQYVTDILDGAVGRHRHTGLILWGFYMDHFCDYLFGCALVAAYTIIYRLTMEFFFFSAFVMSGIFVHEFLLCIAEGKLNTSGYYGFGPTEIRVIMIIVNFLLPFAPKQDIVTLLHFIFPASAGVAIWLVFKAQRKLWQMDIQQKKLQDNR